ncbi:ATP-binding protein [Pseudoalteromonas sp. MTN2-4]|uniref:ATP-binding protein n=1 Tax=Pseudoalteromonas sp. MTN2-4 TaxID=3056555 RepID=UPI0036F43DCE
MNLSLVLQNLYLAASYVIAAKLCQYFAIEPGNVTPIWLASGICFIWVYLMGNKLLPGVFLGAFIGNVSAYIFNDESPSTLLSIFAGSMNGLGDLLCIWVGVSTMKKLFPNKYILDNVSSVAVFIIVPVILGSLISATFGVTGLWIAELIPSSAFLNVFVTWTIGDFMGILLLVPFLESFLIKKQKLHLNNKYEALEILSILFTAIILIFIEIKFHGQFLSHISIFILIPLLTLYSVRQKEVIITFSAFFLGIFAILVLAISPPANLLEYNKVILQYQLALFSIISTMMFIAASVNNIIELNQKINKEKSMFIAKMSHEIRTPLTGVLGLTDILKKTQLSDKQFQILGNIQDAGRTLRQVIDDILDQSKIEAGKLKIKKSKFKLRTVPDLVVSIFSSEATNKSVVLELKIDRTVPEYAYGDPNRIRQILFNLVSNALKFTSSGSVTITLSWENKMLSVEITDTGMGIDEKSLSKIFYPFEQAEQTLSRKHGGTGLGLSISKSLVEQMGGEIGARSQLSKGTTFWFRIPLPSAERLDNKGSEVLVKSDSKDYLRILVAEDVKINQIIIEAMLKAEGHQYTFANDGLEALEQLETNNYDVILMDIRMPNMDGLEALKAIRKLKDDRRYLPVIAVTAEVEEGSIKEFIESGFDAVEHKPIDSDSLFNTINYAVNQHRSSDKKLSNTP